MNILFKAPLFALFACLALTTVTPLEAQVIRTIRTDSLSADLVDRDAGFELRLPDRTIAIVDMARLLIREDGLYEQPMSGELRLIAETRGPTDQAWLALKSEVEAFRVEYPDRPGLIDTLLDLDIADIPVRDVHDHVWAFDRGNADDMGRYRAARDVLVNAHDAGTLRLAGTSSKILIGFPPAQAPAPLYWPLDGHAWLYLAPDRETGFFNDQIVDRLLVGQPDWFDVSATLDAAGNPNMRPACLPFGGCGYVETDAVAAVRPIWIALDRTTLTPMEMWID